MAPLKPLIFLVRELKCECNCPQSRINGGFPSEHSQIATLLSIGCCVVYSDFPLERMLYNSIEGGERENSSSVHLCARVDCSRAVRCPGFGRYAAIKRWPCGAGPLPGRNAGQRAI